MRQSNAYASYIAESITLVDRYLANGRGPNKHLLHEDPMTQDVVLRRLETLADATTHLSPDLRNDHPEVEWEKIANVRNSLTPGSPRLDLDLVWKTIVEDLPALKAVVDQEVG